MATTIEGAYDFREEEAHITNQAEERFLTSVGEHIHSNRSGYKPGFTLPSYLTDLRSTVKLSLVFYSIDVNVGFGRR